jgi:hypothetical protein
MPKSRRVTKKLKRRTRNKSRKMMRGGDLNDGVVQQLTQNKFTSAQISRLNSKNASVDNINKGIDFYNDNAPELITGITLNLEDNLQPLDSTNFDTSSFVTPTLTQQNQYASTDTTDAAPVDSSALPTADPTATTASNLPPDSNVAPTNLSTSAAPLPDDLNAPTSAASTTDPNAASTTDPNAASITDPNAASITDPNAASTTDPNAASTTDPNAASTTDPNAASTTDPNNPPVQTTGGRRSKRRFKRKNRKTQKGGKLYGSGYGANCSDPNQSIYNTNMKTLFPYRAK